MNRDSVTALLALRSTMRAMSAEDAWRVLDVLEALHAAIWAMHEEGLVELCMRALDKAPEPADEGDEPTPF